MVAVLARCPWDRGGGGGCPLSEAASTRVSCGVRKGLGHPGRGDRAAAVCGERRQPAMVFQRKRETDFHWAASGSTWV